MKQTGSYVSHGHVILTLNWLAVICWSLGRHNKGILVGNPCLQTFYYMLYTMGLVGDLYIIAVQSAWQQCYLPDRPYVLNLSFTNPRRAARSNVSHGRWNSNIRGFLKWNPGSLSPWQKDLNVEVILISDFMNSEIRITSTKICLKWPKH